MARIAGVNHFDAVRTLEKVGFRIVRQGMHIVMSDGTRIVTIQRRNAGKRVYDGRHRSRRGPHTGAVSRSALNSTAG